MKVSISGAAFSALFCPFVQAQTVIVDETEMISVIEIEPQLANTGRQSTRLSNAMTRLNNGKSDVEKSYNDFKSMLAKDYGLQYSLDVSMMGQKGVPNGGKTATQSIYAPTLSWQMFNNDFGSGTLNASYTAVRYWGNTAANIGNALFLANSINDFTTESNSFDQLSYTQTMFDNKLSITIGQFPLYDFDGTQYDSNQQVNFINYALSQNASETYPIAGLGAYIQFNPNSEWSFTVGMQNARNVTGQTLSGKGWGDKRFTTFGSISYTPTINGQSGQYSVMVYNQPNVVTQPENSVGWSVNLSQNITEKWGVFMRANAATGNAMPISQSYVFGGVYNNPMNRNPQDQIGLAVAYNKVDKNNFNAAVPMRRFETVVETFWNIGITQFFSIAPDIQLYIHPASKTNRDFGTVFSLRGTFQL
ncbi:MAG: carbohydrate porin [Alphaproteobacteria bacterium]|nr:carbohydrate porin [Alphaproteobacteria bacterium]